MTNPTEFPAFTTGRVNTVLVDVNPLNDLPDADLNDGEVIEAETEGEPETKADAFKRLATFRYTKVIERIRLLEPLANANNYEYDYAEVEVMFALLHAELNTTLKLFKADGARVIESPFS